MIAFPDEVDRLTSHTSALDPHRDRYTIKAAVVGALIGVDRIASSRVVCDKSTVEILVGGLIADIVSSPIHNLENFTDEFSGTLANVVRGYVRGSISNTARRHAVASILEKAKEVPLNCNDSFVLKLIREFLYKGFAMVSVADQLNFVHQIFAGEFELAAK